MQTLSPAPALIPNASISLDAVEALNQVATIRAEDIYISRCLKVILPCYNFVYVQNTKTVFYSTSDSPNTYKRTTDRLLQNIVRDAYLSIGELPIPRKMNPAIESLTTMIRVEAPTEDTRFMAINDNLFWDTHKSEFTPAPSAPCFKHLFDNADLSSSSIISIDPEHIDEDRVQSVHKEAFRALLCNGGDLPQDDKHVPYFAFIATWACGDHGVYMDLLKAAATLFMSNKPKKVFALSGLKRNGKTSYLAMLHTLLGRANTSSIKIEKMGDKHGTEDLARTLMNAPDEETPTDELSDTAISFYKSIASHEPISLEVMREGQNRFITTDFTCFMPYNQDPVWRGNGAAACAERMVIIPFRADLSKFDTAGKDFKRETFTPDMYTDLIGVLTAIARYYNDKEMTFSETSMAETEHVNRGVDQMKEYATEFLKFFCGYDRDSVVFDDYTLWCEENGYSYKGDTKDALIYQIGHLGGTPRRTNKAINKGEYGKVWVYPICAGTLVMSDQLYISGVFGNISVKDKHERRESIMKVYQDIQQARLESIKEEDGRSS